MASLAEIQKLLEDIRLDINTAITRQRISANQVHTDTGLSDITERLGLIQAGEFRVGNSIDPGFGFTGGRFGYPGFNYGGTEYFLAGVDNDVLQVGLSLMDGKIYGGTGIVVLDADGIRIKNGSVVSDVNGYAFIDASTGVVQGGTFIGSSAHTYNIVTLKSTSSVRPSQLILSVFGTSVAFLDLIADSNSALPAAKLTVFQSGNTLNQVFLTNIDTLTMPVRNTNPLYGEDWMYYNLSTHALYIGGATKFERISNQPYGSFYGLDIAQAQAAAQNTWYAVADADIVAGRLNDITIDSPVTGILTVPTAGTYLANWDVSVDSSAANKHIQVGLYVAGAAVDAGRNHVEATGATELALGGSAIVALTANQTVQLAFRTIDAGNPTITIHDVSLSLVRIGE